MKRRFVGSIKFSPQFDASRRVLHSITLKVLWSQCWVQVSAVEIWHLPIKPVPMDFVACESVCWRSLCHLQCFQIGANIGTY